MADLKETRDKKGRLWRVGDTFEKHSCEAVADEMCKDDCKRNGAVAKVTALMMDGKLLILNTDGYCWNADAQQPTGDTLARMEEEVSKKEKEEDKFFDSDVEKTPAAIKGPKNVTVIRDGDKIILPEGMTIENAVKWLRTKEKEDEQKIAIDEQIECYPFDGAYAMTRALAQIYGWVGLVPTPGTFFTPEQPPVYIGVSISPTEKVQVPWSRMAIPALEGGWICPNISLKDGRWIYAIAGEVKQKFKGEIRKIAELTRKIVKESSIYRGKAFHVRLQPVDEHRDTFNPNDCPTFVDTSKINEAELVLTKEVQRQVECSLFTPIEKTDICREHKIPLKRGILFEGVYGCGKTMTAYVAAKKAEQNGWTFIYLESVQYLKQAIYFAQQYAPAIVFGEDIDRSVAGERSQDMDAILNTIDGIDTKGKEVIVVLTTNHVENINPAMLRPGRLDAIISLKPPDAEAAVRLVKVYARELLQDDIDLLVVGKKLAGQIPAVIRECVERAKLAAISHLEPGFKLTLTVEDLDVAADTMLNHLELMKPKKMDGDKNALERVAQLVAADLSKAVWTGETAEKIVKQTNEIHSSTV